MPRRAAIDVGTNSVRLLVAEVADPSRAPSPSRNSAPGSPSPQGARPLPPAPSAGLRRSLYPLLRQIAITRLGEGLQTDGLIRPAAAARTAAAVERFVRLAAPYDTPPPIIVGTYALRVAHNPEELLDRLPFPVRVLDGEDEARLGFYGALAGLESLSPSTGVLVMDIGGGSIEVTRGTARDVRESLSLPLGAVTLTQQFLSHDPPLDAEVTALRRHLARVLPPSLARLRGRRFRVLGVGGTITTMAALAQHLDPYDPDRVHGFRLPVRAVDALTRRLCAQPLRDRRRLPGLQPERADIIPAGALVLQHLLRTLHRQSITASEADLLWALVLDL